MIDSEVLPPQEATLLNRLASYTLCTKAINAYNFLKSNSPQPIKTGLFERCETLATSVAQQPLITLAIKTTGIEKRAEQLLDKFDNAVAKASSINRRRTELQTQVYQTISKSVTQPLDFALEVVNKYAPEEHSESESSESASSSPNSSDVAPAKTVDKLAVLKQQLQKVAKSKLSSLKLRSQEQIASMRFAVNLIEYAKEHIDKQKFEQVHQASDKLIKKAVEATHTVWEKTDTALTVVKQTAVAARKTAQENVEQVRALVVTAANVMKDNVEERVVQAKTVIAPYVSSIANRIQESQWKQKFDEVIGPHLEKINDRSRRVAFLALSTFGTALDFTLQQLNLAKQREWSQVLENMSNLARSAIEQTKTISATALETLEAAVITAQHILMSLVESAGTMNIVDTVHSVLQLQARFIEVLSITVPNVKAAAQ